jgi:hypothetical protein
MSAPAMSAMPAVSAVSAVSAASTGGGGGHLLSDESERSGGCLGGGDEHQGRQSEEDATHGKLLAAEAAVGRIVISGTFPDRHFADRAPMPTIRAQSAKPDSGSAILRLSCVARADVP